MAENYLVKVLIPTYFPFIGARGRKQSRFGAGERLRKFEYSTIPWDHIAGINCVIREIFLKYPPESIRKEIFHLQNKLLENLDRNYTMVLELPDKNRSGILVIDPLGNYNKIVKKLGQRGVITTAPIGYIRLAPHFYNDEEQMHIAASHLNELLEEFF